MTQTEELLIRMGFDASAVARGTSAMLETQATAGQKYIKIWSSAAAKAASETETIWQATAARILAKQKAMQAEIAAGSIPQSWQPQIAANEKYGRKVAGGSLTGTGGMIASSIAGDITSGAHADQLARDAESGAVVGALFALGHSLERLLIHKILPKIIGNTVGRAIAVVGAAIGGWEIGKWLNRKYIGSIDQESQNQVRGTRDIQSKDLLKYIEQLQSLGKLDPDQAKELMGLAGGSETQMGNARKKLERLFPNGMNIADEKKAQEQARDQDKMREEHWKNLREEGDAQEKLTTAKFQEYLLQQKLSDLQPDSKEYAEKMKELEELRHDIAQDTLEVEKEKTNQSEKQVHLNEEASDLSRRIAQNNREMAQREIVYPSIADLAGRGYTSRLNAQYGAGGRFDLGRGNGAYGDIAREYELAEKQQLWDRTYGNTDAAESDRQRMISSRDKLISAGVASPELQWEKMRENTDAMKDHLQKLVEGGAVISTKIASE